MNELAGHKTEFYVAVKIEAISGKISGNFRPNFIIFSESEFGCLKNQIDCLKDQTSPGNHRLGSKSQIPFVKVRILRILVWGVMNCEILAFTHGIIPARLRKLDQSVTILPE